jgi:Flp pilus assembly protein TadG
MPRSRRTERGQVLVMFALGLVVLLGIAGIAIDLGRMMAERRHLQTAADAGALAGCQSLISGSVADINAATARARSVASVNIAGSPSGTTGTMAATAEYADADGDGFLSPDELTSGVVVSSTSVRLAISSTIRTTLASVIGIPTLGVGARAHCTLEHEPALPIVARRYSAPPGPGGGFVDNLATLATSDDGSVDTDPRGYGGRTPASVDFPGPTFEIYGNESKAHNDSSFRGFIALDVRNFIDETSRQYYNGVDGTTSENELKGETSQYLIDGYRGPPFPAATTPPTGALQVATLSGHNTDPVVQNFGDAFDTGDRIMLAVYDGTVMAIPDFSITPPPRITLPATTATPTDGPSFQVSRNANFTGTVALDLLGDASAPASSDNILPVAGTGPPGAGTLNEPVFNPDNFFPAGPGTIVVMEDFSTNAIAPGIYTVWVQGTSSTPVKVRRHPVAVYIGGATRDFNLTNSELSGATDTPGATISLPIRLRSESWGATGTAVALSWDSSSFTNCLRQPAALGIATIGFSPSSVTPAGGQGGLSTLTVDTDGLAAGCYMFTIRAKGTNGDGQPVTHLTDITFLVNSQPGDGSYVEITGFTMFEVVDVVGNTITGRAIGPICGDPNCVELRQVQRARLIPWP